ncbi:MAG TPA: thioredoxin domain-containing protein [Candidatus Paceibacterota bacterium]|nr:thioredoxin domain-containing protein [Candidatus Paceibacterota bacterium]
MSREQQMQLWMAAGFLGLIVVITVVAALASGSGKTNVSAPSFTATQTSPITASDHGRGNATAKVTFIEYGDFECPACGAYEPYIEQLYKTYGTQVDFVFRNFPLYQIHPFAMISAQAAEAANLQGQYWPMHDLLYTKQSEWSTNAGLSSTDVVSKYFNGYAQSLGLNVTQFDADINSAAVKARVQSDIDSGNAAKIDHTPTFFINLIQIPNPTSEQDFEHALNAALASSTASTSTTL